MKKQLRIPTIIALLILIVGLIVTSIITGQAQKIFLKADITQTAKNVKKSNISDTSFTISWTTDRPVSGSISYSESKNGAYRFVSDDRVQSGVTDDKFYTHHVTITLLKPAMNYYYKIISGSQEFNDASYLVKTASSGVSSDSLATPAYGVILNSDLTPAVGALVYMTVNNSSLLSTYTKSSGNWLASLNKARTADLSRAISFKPKGDPEEILVQGEKDQVAQVKVVTGNDAPVPNITLGKNYDFTADSTTQKTSHSITLVPTQTIVLTKTNFIQQPLVSPTPAILIPNNNSSISDSHPTIQGAGLPGQVVQIIVHSDQTMAASVVVDSDGRWSWSPPQSLDPGAHTVTIATADNSGQTKTVTQNFTVLGSGTSVTQSATPSATVTPTFAPTPSASPSPLPKTGGIIQTSLLLLSGMSILFLGAIFFYANAF